MHERRALAHARHDLARRDMLQQAAQVGIVGGILADDRILHGEQRAPLDEARERLHLHIVFAFDVQRERDARRVDNPRQACFDAL